MKPILSDLGLVTKGDESRAWPGRGVNMDDTKIAELMGKVQAHVALGAGVSGITRRAALIALAEIRERLGSRAEETEPPAFMPGGAFCACGRVEFVVPGTAVARTHVVDGKGQYVGSAALHRPDGCRAATWEELSNLRPPSSSVGGDSRGTGAVPSDGEEPDPEKIAKLHAALARVRKVQDQIDKATREPIPPGTIIGDGEESGR